MEKFEQWRQDGVTAEDAKNYAAWLEKNVLPLRKENWVPTPLPVVYIGKQGEFIRLPFLDLNFKSKVFGVAVDRVCYRKTVYRYVLEYGFIGVVSHLNELQADLYPPKKNVLSRIFSAESIYAHDFFVPTLDLLQRAYRQREAFDATVRILCANGVTADMWNDGKFICQDDAEPSEFHRVTDFATGVVSDYDSSSKGSYWARPATYVSDYDVPYPVEDGDFNWKMWKECESAL